MKASGNAISLAPLAAASSISAMVLAIDASRSSQAGAACTTATLYFGCSIPIVPSSSLPRRSAWLLIGARMLSIMVARNADSSLVQDGTKTRLQLGFAPALRRHGFPAGTVFAYDLRDLPASSRYPRRVSQQRCEIPSR